MRTGMGGALCGLLATALLTGGVRAQEQIPQDRVEITAEAVPRKSALIEEAFPSSPHVRNITLEALANGQGILPTLETALQEALGERPVLLDISTTWCMPCRQNYPEIVEYAKANPGVSVIMAVVDDELVGPEPTAGLRLLYGASAFPSYIAFSRDGERLNETTSDLATAVTALEHGPSPTAPVSWKAALVRIINAYDVPMNARQVAVIADENPELTVAHTLGDVIAYVGKRTGVAFEGELPEIREGTYVPASMKEVSPTELVKLLSDELHNVMDSKGKMVDPEGIVRSQLKEYAATLPEGGAFSIRPATELTCPEGTRRVYDSLDLYRAVQFCTRGRVQVFASPEVREQPYLFAHHGGLLELLMNEFDRSKPSVTAADTGYQGIITVRPKQ